MDVFSFALASTGAPLRSVRSFVVAVVVLFDVIGEIMEWFEERDG